MTISGMYQSLLGLLTFDEFIPKGKVECSFIKRYSERCQARIQDYIGNTLISRFLLYIIDKYAYEYFYKNLH